MNIQHWKLVENQLLPISKKQKHILKDRLTTMKKGTFHIDDEYLQKFKLIFDKLAAINEFFFNLDKAFQFARKVGSKCIVFDC